MVLFQRLSVAWVTSGIGLALAALFLSEMTIASAGDLIVAAVVFGFLNTFLKPVARLLTLPLAIVTLGVAWFFVSMLMLYITDELVSGLAIHGFWTLVWATIIVWIPSVVIDGVVGMWETPDRPGAARSA